MEKFSILRPSEGSLSKATPLEVQCKRPPSLLDSAALPKHSRTCRSAMGLLVGNASVNNKPASRHYFGFNINYNDVPFGNANALHIHKTFEYFMAFSGDFEIRAGHDARSSVVLKKFDSIVVPAFYKRYFKCIATTEQMHYCEEMKENSDGNCALILAGIVGPPWVQWSKETVAAARSQNILCTKAGVLYDADEVPPPDELLEDELDCSQQALEACVLRAADRPVVTMPYGDGDMRFEYVDVQPGAAGRWKADSTRNYCVWLLEGTQLIVQHAGTDSDTLMEMEMLVVPKGRDWGLGLGEDVPESSLVYLISSSMSEDSYPEDVLKRMERATKRARTEGGA